MHYGELLAEVVAKSGVSVTWLAAQAGYKRGTYYTHITKPDLSLAVLERYEKPLGYDFSKHFPEKYRTGRRRHSAYREIEEDRDYWRDKYTELLKEYDRLRTAFEQLRESLKERPR